MLRMRLAGVPLGLIAHNPSLRISHRMRRRPTKIPSRNSATCNRRLSYTGCSVKIRSSRFSRSSSSANPAGVGNRSCRGRSRTACIAGLRTAPRWRDHHPPLSRRDGGLPGRKIAFDLQLADLAVQPRANNALARFINSCFRALIIVGWTPNSDDSSARVFSPDSAAIATRALKSALCCFLFTLTSHASLDRQSSAYPTVQKTGAAALTHGTGKTKPVNSNFAEDVIRAG